jgi:predicted GIY-YIG superfamily endonuclease
VFFIGLSVNVYFIGLSVNVYFIGLSMNVYFIGLSVNVRKNNKMHSKERTIKYTAEKEQ